LASASVALNTSALYIGQAMGAAIGGLVIATGDFSLLSWVALVAVAAAIGVSALARRMGPAH
jgi:predicted MFS family arabinose efflux permease